MKRLKIVIILFAFVGVFLLVFFYKNVIANLSETRTVKIRAFSSITGDTYKDYMISDAGTVQEICDVFSDLKLKKDKSYCKPYDVKLRAALYR